MRTLECILIAIIAAVLGAAFLHGQPPAVRVERAKTAKDCGCGCEGEGDCTRCECSAAAAKAKALAELFLASSMRDRDREDECMEDAVAAFRRAQTERKPMFLWVAMSCTAHPSIRKEFPAAVHCHAASNAGDATPRLLVFPIGSDAGWPFPRRDFGERTTPAAIRDTLKFSTHQRKDEDVIFQRIAQRIAALQLVQNLTPTQHAQLQAAAPTTPQSQTQLASAVTAVTPSTPPSSTPATPSTSPSSTPSASSTASHSHPFLSLLQSYLSNPQELQTAVSEIQTIVALFQ